MMPFEKHPTHRSRGSDSSYYDFICDNCLVPETNPAYALPFATTTGISPKDCSTCTYRTMPDDVDWTNMPCENCLLGHLGKSKEWPFWSQRTPEQFKADADAGHKVKIRC